MALNTESRFAEPDAVYERLLRAHEGLDEGESAALDVRLVLLLANHIGSAEVLDEAIARARATIQLRRSESEQRPG